MTKIKNTKKGMAKKTLSISLAVAMLATSNVPVWAAEFSDGTDAAFTSEAETPAEVVEEAPVVEDETNVPEATAENSVYDVTFETAPGVFETNMEWGTAYPTTIKVTEKNGNALNPANLKFRWLDNNNQEFVEFDPGDVVFDKVNEHEAEIEFKTYFPDGHVGKTYKLQVYEKVGNTLNVIAVSAPITVAKKSVTANVTFSNEADKAVRYTGQQIELAREAITNAIDSLTYTGTVTSYDVADDAYKNANWTVTGDDTINAALSFDGPTVHAIGKFEDERYKVTAEGDFVIWRKSFSSIDEAVKAELPKYEYEFTGTDITVPGSAITITDKVTNKVVAGAASDFTIGGWTGSKTDKVSVDMKEGSLKNLSKNDKDFTAVDQATPAQEVKVVPRDLSNTENTQISVNTITKDELKQEKLSLDTVKKNLVIKDADGTNLMNNSEFKNRITVKFKDTTDSEMKVESGKSYTVVIGGNNNEIVKEREVTLNVIAYDLNDASFTGGVLSQKANQAGGLNTEYTGEKITYGITAENMTEQLGDLTINNGTTTLVKGVSYEASVKFGENTNAGEAEIIIDGKGDYAGTSKVIKFNITQRTPATGDNWLVVPEKVLYNANNREATDYTVETSVVAKFKDVDVNNVADRTKQKEYTVTVPADNYVINDRSFETAPGNKAGNEVGNFLVTNVERAASVATTSNFGHFDFTKKSELVNKAITEADVILEKTEYTYAAKEITPDYKVVVDGVTLEKGKDYTEQITHGTNVGEATLVITGKGDYDDTSVSKKFNIVAANISDLKVTAKTEGNVPTYNGEQHLAVNELDIMLGDENVADEIRALFPTSKTANINAGDATVTLKADARISKNFVGEKEFTFTIAPATLTDGEFSAFDKNGTKLDLTTEKFEYDGTAHTFFSTKYENKVTAPMEFTADDYEIIYRDNIVGDADGKGHVLVVAKGNYKAAGEYECANGEVVKNVLVDTEFAIDKLTLNKDNTEVVVENGAYAEGKDVEPVVTVTYKGKKLVQDVDYKLDLGTQSRKEVTNGKTLKVDIDGIGGYKGSFNAIAWGIDKFDLENAEVIVSGTDEEPNVKLLNNGIVISADEYDLVAKDGKATVTAKASSKNYTGDKEFDIKEALEKPETPEIVDVQVTGNKAKVILAGESEGAFGYDYVISKNRNCIVDKDYAKVNKNKLNTDTTFQYIEPQGVYYAYCHAWVRNEETGKKEFSDWSNAFAFTVSAITPGQPVVTDVDVKGSTVTVTYTQSANAEGYDVVLGSEVATVFDEKRPVEYGTLVKKNISGNTVTATFKNVPKGTYYAGLHAFNRTSEDGKKVFSPWSNTKTVTVK